LTEVALIQQRSRLMALLAARLDDRASDDLAPLLRRLSGLSDRTLRQHRIVEIMQQSCDQLSFHVLRWLWETARRRDLLAREVLLDLVTARPLTETLGYEKVRALYAHAHAKGAADICRVFLTPADINETIKHKGVEVENRAMYDVSLGLRKTYARGHDRFTLDRLLFDLNPAVIRNLLRNPRIVERDVVRIAALRPTNGRVLHEVYRCTRWISRYPVKKAIVFNPHTPADIALALLSHMMRQDLRVAATSSKLSEEIKLGARALLDERTGR
jgi:hypothetical protein